MNELTVVTIVCDSFILGRYEAPAMRETLSLLTHSPLHIATLRCTDKIGCIATRMTLACPSRCDLHDQPARNGGVSTESDFAVRGVWDRVAREFVRTGNSVYPSAELRGGAWPSCAFVKWSASSLSCPLSTPVQRPGSSRQRAAGHVFPDVY